MTPYELALEIHRAAADAAERAETIGAEQYSDGQTQQFETMPLDELFEYADEELLDLINYAVMTRIRLNRLRVAIGERTANHASE